METGRKKKQLTVEQQDRIFQLFYQEGYSKKQINKITKIPTWSISYLLLGRMESKVDIEQYKKPKQFKIPNTCTIYGLKGFADVDRKCSKVEIRAATEEELRKFEGIQAYARPMIFQMMMEG